MRLYDIVKHCITLTMYIILYYITWYGHVLSFNYFITGRDPNTITTMIIIANHITSCMQRIVNCKYLNLIFLNLFSSVF